MGKKSYLFFLLLAFGGSASAAEFVVSGTSSCNDTYIGSGTSYSGKCDMKFDGNGKWCVKHTYQQSTGCPMCDEDYCDGSSPECNEDFVEKTDTICCASGDQSNPPSGDWELNGTCHVEEKITNQAPVIAEGDSIPVNMSEDSDPTPFNLTLNATDANSDTLTWSIKTAASKGTASVSGTGTQKAVSYVPNENQNGSDSFIVEVSDGKGGKDEITVNVEITAVNDAPAITGQNPTATNEEAAYTVKLEDLIVSDVDNSYPNGFTLSVQGGSNYTRVGNTITPVKDFTGTLSVPVTINDGSDDSAVFNLSVKVNNLNDAPKVTGQNSISTNEEIAYTVKLEDLIVSDVDNSYPNGFTLSVQGGTNYTRVVNTITPVKDFTGTLSVPVTINDGSDDSAVFNLSLKVNNLNDAPKITGFPSTSATEDFEYSFVPLVTDVDAGDTKTFTITNKPEWATFDEATGKLSGTPDNSHVGTTSGIVISVKDAAGATASLPAFNIEVENTNDFPVFTSDPLKSVKEDSEYSYKVEAKDVDAGDKLTFSVLSHPDWLSFNDETHVLSGTPTNSDVGIHSVIIRVGDGTVAKDQSFIITVENTNDKPVITSKEEITVNEDGSYLYIFTAKDDDTSDKLTFSAPVLPKWLSFNQETGALYGTPTNENVGTHNVTLRVNDGTVDVDQVFTITVVNTNDAPVITSTPVESVNEDAPYSYTFEATDVDSKDKLTLSALILPKWLTFDPATGVLSGTPTNSDVRNHFVSLRVNDGTENIDQNFLIKVINTNDAPEINGIPAISVDEDSKYSFTPTATDVDYGDTKAFEITNKPGWATFNDKTGELSGTPDNSHVGTTAGIVISLIDAAKEKVSLPPFSIEVKNTNDKPEISGAPATSVNEDTEYSFTPTAKDVDAGDTKTFEITNKPVWATFNDKTGELSGTPDNSHVGTTSGIVITVKDAAGEKASLPAFSIEVKNVNDKPVISGTPTISVNEDSEYSFTPTASDVDAVDTKTFEITNKPVWANFDEATGKLSGTPDNSHVGTTSGIIISVKDAAGEKASLPAFSIEVKNTNDTPVITEGETVSVTMSEDSAPNAFALSLNAKDDDSDEVTWSISTNASNGTATAEGKGSVKEITYKPAENYNGNDSFVVTVKDGNGGEDSITVNVKIDAVNDKPEITSTAVTAINEDSPYSYTFTATDVDTTDKLTLSAPVLPVWLSFDPATGILSGTPTNDEVGDHNVTLRVNDGTVDVDQNFTIIVSNVSDKPVITLSKDKITFIENAEALILDAEAVVEDVDSPHFNGGNLTVTISENFSTNDILPITDTKGEDDEELIKVTVEGDDRTVSYKGNVIGTVSGGNIDINDETQFAPLVINFTSEDATLEAVTALVKAISFENVSENPLTDERTVSFVVTDEANGAVSDEVTLSLIVEKVQDRPVLSEVVKASEMQGKTVTFTAEDFTTAFSDADDEKMTKIKITSIPVEDTEGTLLLGSDPVEKDDEIEIADIKDLTFTPAPEKVGEVTFSWNASDGSDDSEGLDYAEKDSLVRITLAEDPNSNTNDDDETSDEDEISENENQDDEKVDTETSDDKTPENNTETTDDDFITSKDSSSSDGGCSLTSVEASGTNKNILIAAVLFILSLLGIRKFSAIRKK